MRKAQHPLPQRTRAEHLLYQMPRALGQQHGAHTARSELAQIPPQSQARGGGTLHLQGFAQAI